MAQVVQRASLHTCMVICALCVCWLSLFTYLLFFSFLSLLFQPFQTPFSAVHKKFMSQSLRNFRSGTVVSNDPREAGARVRLNTMVRDLDLLPGALLDNLRLEVVADGLPLFNGAQLAIDTTMVSGVRGDGTARRGAQHTSGTAIMSARRRKELTHPELSGDEGRARLMVLATEVGGQMVPGGTSVLGRAGKGQVPRGTTSIARQCEGGLVAQVELSLRLHCGSVFCAVPRRRLGTRRERPHSIGERCVVGHAPHLSVFCFVGLTV